MTVFITSLLFVVLAEMGDKTQLLAMSFAMKYRWQTVMWGVFAATLLNHLLAVLIGTFMTTLVPMSWIQIASSISFIIFGLWTIRGDTATSANETSNRSPFWIVAIAFFIAECGDKTQLATVALAAQYNTILPVWLGTTTGMMIADAIGIIFGVVMGRKIPENTVKWFAAIVFIAFGLVGLYETVPQDYWRMQIVIGLMVAIIAAIGVILRMNGQLMVQTKDGVGSYLTDSKGMTLYTFKKDSDGKSACEGDCLAKWPLFYDKKIKAPKGVDKKDFGVITRTYNKKKQTTFRGLPLYYFAKDQKKGDTNGQGLIDAWHVVDPTK